MRSEEAGGEKVHGGQNGCEKEGRNKKEASNQKESSEEQEGKVLRRERYSGKYVRSFNLGTDIEQSDINAKFEDGLLHPFVQYAWQRLMFKRGFRSLSSKPSSS